MRPTHFLRHGPRSVAKPHWPATAVACARLAVTAGVQFALPVKDVTREKIASNHRPKSSAHREDDIIEASRCADVLVRSTTHSGSTICMASNTALSASKTKSSDALATVSPCDRDPGVQYGASSTIAFVERIQVTLGKRIRFDELSNSHTDECNLETLGVERAERQASQLSGLDLLPVRKVADSYLKCFWDIPHSVFPILHKPAFMQFYRHIWEPATLTEMPETIDDLVMLATLNLVLAIGCRFSAIVHIGSRTSTSDHFYQRARKIVSVDALDVASLPVVQMLLLTALHLQSTMYSSRCWNLVGLAIRVAQSLGLHLDRSDSISSNQLEREMRRRIWYTCVTLERLMCTTFGRPAMLTHSSLVPLPLMVDDEYLLENGEGTQPVASKCRIGVFIHSIHLLDILNEVLSSFYPGNGGAQVSTTGNHLERSTPDMHEMLRLNLKLDQFFESLPRELRLQAPSENSGVSTVTFSASTIAIAALLCSPQDDTRTSVDNPLSLAMAILRHYAPEVESATRAIQVLEGLRNRLQERGNTGAPVPHAEGQQTQGTNESSCRGYEVMYDSGVGNIAYHGQSHAPDPLSEDWFTGQAQNFAVQDYL
ncbi:fungal-specific transcription factor domain-containing protein [Penicillium canescens]|uniref:Fungal-specific transcription factor domain-containing protein n=1 Tax=Penicillium canescens TaxID=5083 RepID=A0AAD6I968_PENCN|nr:fungal-specific transcription factor domain-containing protein [Penicillium canescens]KAJ6038242.1 fungal-specific transcription factor domain-containing protein [Penicillium canescens]KAJ6039638.1 fungal-specific transcription factor domain-containing protein [Penicillium canescens]KAJ6068015.1 fungal-specific transcription factor domain-containing protein [Penicillium canescens]